MKYHQATLVYALGALVLTGGLARAAVKEWPVATRDVGKAPLKQGYHVFRSAEAWQKASNGIGFVKGYRGRRERPAVDRVNWDREMVLAASLGEKPTAGYAVDITSVKRVGREIVVTVRETSPTPDMMVAQVITFSVDTVAVKRMAIPVVFVVNGVRRAPGDVKAAPVPQGDNPQPVADTSGLAKSLFVVRESGGIAGVDRQTYVHLYGRPIKAGEEWPGARENREAKVNGPLVRQVERAVRDSGFTGLENRYAAGRVIPDGMARTIRVHIDGQVKTVTVEDGADIPQAFEDVWAALQTALNSKGTTVTARP